MKVNTKCYLHRKYTSYWLINEEATRKCVADQTSDIKGQKSGTKGQSGVKRSNGHDEKLNTKCMCERRVKEV